MTKQSDSESAQRVAFIGLGNMGIGMAANLVKQGFQVVGYDLVEANLQAARNAGCETAASAVDAVQNADYVISMLPNGRIVEDLYIDQDQLLDSVPAHALVIDSSTIAADNARRVGLEADARGIAFVDAPVSGGVAAAQAGSLSFMVGGSDEHFAAAKMVLKAMGANTFRAGPIGAGQIAKMCNNMLLAIHMAGSAEALQLGIAQGLDPAVLSEIMLNSSGCNWSLQKYNPVPGVMDNVPASKDYQPGFMVDLMLKDLGLASEAAQSSQSAIPLGSMARNLFSLHKQSGDADKGQRDFSSIFESYSSGAFADE